jgi:hypothetical protein
MRTRRQTRKVGGVWPFSSTSTTSEPSKPLFSNPNEPGQMVNELTAQELEEINKQQKEELTSWSQDKENLIKADMEKLRKLDGKIRKAIMAGVAGYNVAQRRLDNINPNLTREEKSKYPCGSVTCKQRGKKIKNALLEIAKIDEHALGEIGVAGTFESAGNYFTGNKNNESKLVPESVQGGTRRRRR